MKKVLNPLPFCASILLFIFLASLLFDLALDKIDFTILDFFVGIVILIFVFLCLRWSIQIKGGPTDRISSGDWKILYKKAENLLLEHEITGKIFFFKIPEDCIIKIEKGIKKEEMILEQGKSFYFVRKGKDYMVFPQS